MYLHRTVVLPENKTSIALERIFWESIDLLSDGDWRQWVKEMLAKKPADVGRGTYLRQVVHKAAMQGQLHA
jgi:hypothetical protein